MTLSTIESLFSVTGNGQTNTLVSPSARISRYKTIKDFVNITKKHGNNKEFTLKESPMQKYCSKVGDTFLCQQRNSKGNSTSVCVDVGVANFSSMMFSESFLMVQPKKQTNNDTSLVDLLSLFNMLTHTLRDETVYELLLQLFSNDIDLFETFCKDLQKRNEKVSSLFIAFSVNVVSFNSYILLQKDRMRISDSLYHEIRIRFFLEKYLPPLDDLKDTRKEKNIEVLGFYDVNIRSVSYVASVQHEKEQIYEDIDEPEDACEDTCQNICQDSCQNISSNPTQDNQSSNSVGVAMSMSSNVLNESPVTVKGNKKQTTVVFVKNITKLVKSILKLELIETINRQTKGKVISENDMAFLEKATKEAIMSYGMDQKGLNGLTVLGVSMRGSRVFNAQCPFSIIPLALWNGKEKDILFISNIIRAELDELRKQVVVIEYNGKNYKYELKNKLVTDLSAFKYLNGWSRINCPFCDCPNAHSSIKQGCTVVERSGNTEISNCLGFDHTDFIICYLHLLERIIQHLLRLSLGTAEENFDSMVKEIQMVSTLRNLMFEPDENGDYNLYLTGDQCEALLQGRAKFFKNCPKHIQELWNEGNHILDIFKKGLSNGDYQDFQLSLDRFFQKFKKYSTIGSWYVHIIMYHGVALLKTYGGLSKWSAEGFEHFHRLLEYILENCVQHGTNTKEYWYLMLKKPTKPSDYPPLPTKNTEILSYTDMEFSSDNLKNPSEERYGRKDFGCSIEISAGLKLAQILAYFLRCIQLTLDLDESWNRIENRTTKTKEEEFKRKIELNNNEFSTNPNVDGVNSWIKVKRVKHSKQTTHIESQQEQTIPTSAYNKFYTL
ncbi:predicted protein [Naegleria gruberi]|uniref:Predicted protein n=1 Tax=Naegleria gruberi TaxID=5762 RepID=D2W541_NAEGR|nr:uncharacterized protein NAEGRDRAFT_82344 [Naegleria gruberi]EFC35813.1 predicted protein [Naegleria gruberi]|eukprot:XP_002668557.1 predicted protein [Naegleria gruberi strain NEG-M]